MSFENKFPNLIDKVMLNTALRNHPIRVYSQQDVLKFCVDKFWLKQIIEEKKKIILDARGYSEPSFNDGYESALNWVLEVLE